MAIAVIVGIMFATFLTLILVPVMYSLVDDFTAFFRKHFMAVDEEGGEVDSSGGAEDRDGEAAEVGAPGFETTREPEPAHVLRGGKNPLKASELRPQTE
jgi:hypothetical protein